MPDINKSYSWMIETCNALNVGYSQDYRTQQTINGITYYDCSSIIWYALLQGGFDCVTANGGDDYPFWTGSMIPVLQNLGFVEVQPPILAGDIAWRAGHTEMVYQGGATEIITMGAHSAGLPLDRQVSINSEAKSVSKWSRYFRYGAGGAMQFGSNLFVIAAICGNLWQESNLNPGLWEGLRVGAWDEMRHGYGLGQWTNTGSGDGMRLLNFYNWMSQNGYNLEDASAQWQYVIVENIWYPTQEASEYPNLQAFFSSTSNDITALTHAWSIGWEGIHDSSWDLRVSYAMRCLTYIQQHAQDSSITTWVTGNRYLTDDEILNNAVLFYRLLSAGGGGGGIPGIRQSNKFWIYLRYGLF